MKLPEYVSVKADEILYIPFSMNQDSVVRLGDEQLFRYVGAQNGICIADYIYPDDTQEFLKLCKKLSVGESDRIMVPFKDCEGAYRFADFIISNHGQHIENEPVLDVEVYLIFSLEDRIIQYWNNIKKYRTFMAMLKGFYFDYDVKKDLFTMYHYEGSKSVIHAKCTLEEFREMVLPKYERSIDVSDFEELYQLVKTARGNFNFTLKAPLELNSNELGMYRVEGKTVYKLDKTPMVIGLIYKLDASEESNIPYYKLPEGRDSATGLYNKRACHEYSLDILNTENERPHYMCIVDIDNFKEVNDNYGHLFGDEVIAKVAETIESELNDRGIVGRFGGDEFFILTDHIENEQDLRSLLTSIRQKCKTAFEDRIQDFRVTLSIGVSRFPDDGKTYDELFRTSDACVYIAKYKGKNRFIIYDKKKHGEIRDDSNSIRYATNPMEKAEYLADVVADVSNQLYVKGADALDDVLAILRTNFEIDGIRIYSGKTAKLLRKSGTYKIIPDVEEFILEQNYLKASKLKRYFTIGNMEHFKSVDRKFAESAISCNVMAMAGFYFDVENAPDSPYIFMYDIFNHSGRWNDSDRNFLQIISRIMAQFLE